MALCACGCGKKVRDRQVVIYFNDVCRQRAYRARKKRAKK